MTECVIYRQLVIRSMVFVFQVRPLEGYVRVAGWSDVGPQAKDPAGLLR